MSSGWDGRASGNTLTFGPHSDVNISLIDGAAGVGGGATDNFSTDIFVSLAAGDVSPRFGDEFALIPEDEPHSGAEKPISNRRGTVWNTTLVGLVENMRWIHPDVQYGSTSAVQDKNNYNDPKVLLPLKETRVRFWIWLLLGHHVEVRPCLHLRLGTTTTLVSFTTIKEEGLGM